MSEKERNLEQLVLEALENARRDRDKALDAYEKIKNVLNSETQEDKQNVMLIGPVAVKLLEQLTRSNEQVVRLAQIKERQESKSAANEKNSPMNIEDVVNFFEKKDKADGN